MSTNTIPTANNATPWLKPLQRLRWLLRSVSVFDGILLFALLGFGLFWLSLGLDYAFEPTVAVRKAILWIFGIITFVAVLRWLIYPLVIDLPNRSMALLVERQYPEFADSLMTAVELQDQAHEFSPQLIAQAQGAALTQLQKVQFARLLAGYQILRRTAIATTAITSVFLFALIYPDVVQTWQARFLGLSRSVIYPRATKLTLIEGMDGQVQKVARGRGLRLVVEADREKMIPDRVWLRYQLVESGTRNRTAMTKVGQNRFQYEFRNVLASMDLSIRGGDDTLHGLHLQVVEPPTLERVELTADYPKYTRREQHSFPVTGSIITLPSETVITLQIQANKPLQQLVCLNDDTELPLQRLDEKSFQLQQVLRTDLALRLEYLDVDGIGSQEPFPIDIKAVPDQPPSIEAKLVNISKGITKLAVIPIQLKIADDFGLQKGVFEYLRQENKWEQLLFLETTPPAPQNSTISQTESAPPLSLEGLYQFEVTPLSLSELQTLALRVVSTDTDNINGPHESGSEIFPFEIISPDELKQRLAQRELNLRQRFEQILRDLQDAPENLNDLGELLPDTDDSARSLRRLYAERIQQILRKAANETAGVGQEFNDIVAELKNNRVVDSALFDRLEIRIILPILQIVEANFPEVEESLRQLRQQLDNNPSAAWAQTNQALTRLLQQYETILRAMLKMEDFNEMLADLRDIIQMQEKILEETKNDRKKRLLDLLR